MNEYSHPEHGSMLKLSKYCENKNYELKIFKLRITAYAENIARDLIADFKGDEGDCTDYFSLRENQKCSLYNFNFILLVMVFINCISVFCGFSTAENKRRGGFAESYKKDMFAG
ncbi:hypothetical protein [Ferruginibacter sp. HRS2-29]|uniref:hypothetical protein n=1 Tax=Ferruginibacter sp. HRS2-29 TaxID=2487334 RepID=UPI0020CF9823|nr:hypothetical protein [Ferruginibacter sp. HRS2-29]MCP9751235.1 hypothetical protein [Ferruginibacter sp. HRS2-29]